MTKAEDLSADSSAIVSYGEASYWDDRYKQEANQSFDWYQRYSALENLFDKYIPKRSNVLMAGCGNAAISAEMIQDGYKDITNVDISPVVIETMREKYKTLTQCTWEVMDVRSLKFDNDSFDAVVDKGTLDSLMCGDDATVNAKKMLTEVSRVLRPEGIYMMITYGDPRLRMMHLERAQFNWKISLHVIPRPEVTRFSEERQKELIDEPVEVSETGRMAEDLHWDDPDIHFIYVCRKNSEA